MKAKRTVIKNPNFANGLLNFFAKGDIPIRFHDEDQRPTFIWPYSFPFLVALTKWLEKKGWYRFTMKKKGLLFWLAWFLGFVFGSLAIHFRAWTVPVIDNIKFVYGNKLDRYDEKTQRKIFRNIIYRNCKYLARLLIEDIVVFPSYVFFKNLKDQKGKNLERYRKKYEQFYEVKGIENLDEALEKYGGAILLFPHVHSFFIASCYFGFPGYEIMGAADLEGLEAVARFWKASGTLALNAHDPKIKFQIDKFVKTHSKPIFISAADVGYPKQTLLPFFSELCRCPVGPAILSMRYNYPVLPFWEESHPKKFFHTIHVGKVIEFIRDDSIPKRELVSRNMIRCNKVLEKIILKDIAKWGLLPQAHNIKRYNPQFIVQGLNIKDMLLEQLQFFKTIFKESYEENRPDELILARLNRIIDNLENLRHSSNDRDL